MEDFFFTWELSQGLKKIGAFVTVQALVYLVLSKSSNIFSSSSRFRTMDALAAPPTAFQRMLDVLSESPPTADALLL
ncbi:hypothetical protein HPP92_005764 [Vanilla planifolia]|uniref:Uncharacterized protein n=1 Tax=Vanilla planifolia TaxID=51239 RepID=A0A835RHR7_VANPL|nr:hypothetical protein HPP92_005764 [Vanilla planifolia]